MAKKDLRIKIAATEVVFNGNNYVLDLFHMTLLDLNSGTHQPIAWIDEAGECFFLEVFGYCDELHGFLLSYACLPSSKRRITSIIKYRFAICYPPKTNSSYVIGVHLFPTICSEIRWCCFHLLIFSQTNFLCNMDKVEGGHYRCILETSYFGQ
ncbi:hypothetical protein RDI58_024334 [Solanum bulbocastanum]|uniref:RCD1 WWE domain-containing protein n=1 Tax=Solanum bulbocastanum TaxID=147425 RepID=A0AAN8T338_SOLBU